MQRDSKETFMATFKTYTKLRLDFEYGPKDRFYRIVLIKGDPDLFELGVCLGEILGAEFEHDFLFSTLKHESEYVTASAMEEPFEGYKYIRRYHLSDLPDSFRYLYDMGDGWSFKCKRYKKTVQVDSNERLILLEGKGQGIWEDNICTLEDLLDGYLDPESSLEDEEKGIYKPWNFVIDKYGDFDLPLDIEKLNKMFSDLIDDIYYDLLENEVEYVKNNDIVLDDFHRQSPSFWDVWKDSKTNKA